MTDTLQPTSIFGPDGPGVTNGLPDLMKWSIGDIFPGLPNFYGQQPPPNPPPNVYDSGPWTVGSRDDTGASFGEQMTPKIQAEMQRLGIDPNSAQGQSYMQRLTGDEGMNTSDFWRTYGDAQKDWENTQNIKGVRERTQPTIDSAKAYYKSRADRFGAINKAPGQAREGMLRSDSELGGQLSQAEEAINSELGRQRMDTSEAMASRGLGASGKAIDRDRLQSQQAAYLKGQNVSDALQYASSQEGEAIDKGVGLAGIESDLASSDLTRVMNAYNGMQGSDLHSPNYAPRFNTLSANLGRQDVGDAKTMQVITLLLNAIMSASSQGSDTLNSIIGMAGKGG